MVKADRRRGRESVLQIDYFDETENGTNSADRRGMFLPTSPTRISHPTDEKCDTYLL